MTSMDLERILARRVEMGISQRRLAVMAKTSNTYVSDLEAGKKDISTPTARRVLRQLGFGVKESRCSCCEQMVYNLSPTPDTRHMFKGDA